MLKSYMPTLLKYSNMEGTQVIVADNDSKDDSMEMMQREFPEVPLIRLEKNWGFAKGYNMALRQVEAEYYILLNSDVEVSEDWLVPERSCRISIFPCRVALMRCSSLCTAVMSVSFLRQKWLE